MNKIAIPTVRGFREATGHEYVGGDLFGVMISEEREPSVLEINVRPNAPGRRAWPPLLYMRAETTNRDC